MVKSEVTSSLICRWGERREDIIACSRDRSRDPPVLKLKQNTVRGAKDNSGSLIQISITHYNLCLFLKILISDLPKGAELSICSLQR